MIRFMRLDKYLVEKKYFSSRARAKEAIENGDVLVGGVAVTSPDKEVSDGVEVEVKAEFLWVSRGALKLISALDAFHVNPTGLTVLDLGASTGGFTDVLLSRGATKVYAVDVGHGQLHPKLVADARVVNMEGIDVRDLTLSQFPTHFSLVVGDLSFISLGKVLPGLRALVSKNAQIILLVKPQFEVGAGGTKKGIVRDEERRMEVLQTTIREAEAQGFVVQDTFESPVVGGSGNIEYLLYLTFIS
jgi:23S rRNA (cytidine1920-2'-O)/16S rRNA (cytidine1409-2'-O)-methyltransferase